MAQPSEALPLTPDVLPQGLSSFPLPGHFFDMVGFRTDDGVVFAADALVGGATLEKYHVAFVYDVRAYLDSLDSLCAMEASLFVPSHAEPVTDIASLAAQNRQENRGSCACTSSPRFPTGSPPPLRNCCASCLLTTGLSWTPINMSWWAPPCALILPTCSTPAA